MERPESRSSALPRMSKLPQIQPGSAAATAQEPEATMASSTPTPIRHARSNTTELRHPSSVRLSAIPASAAATPNKRQSMLIKPGFQTAALKEHRPDDRRTITSPTSPLSAQSNTSDESSFSNSDARFGAPSTQPRKPSLSDRTVETLSQVPPSPSPRRQSVFYGVPPETSMRPPSRAGSSLGYARPDSRIGGTSSRIRPPERPSSPPKSTASTGLARPGSFTQTRRPASVIAPRGGFSGLQQPSKFQPTSGVRGTTPAKSGIQRPGEKTAFGAARTSSIKSPSKAPTRDVFGGPLRPPSPSKLPGTGSKPSLAPGKLNTPKVSLRAGHKAASSVEEEVTKPAVSPEKKMPGTKSLRETIAQAKATQRDQPSAFVPRAAVDNTFASIGPDSDPNSLDFVESPHVNILKKRILNARADGKLNITSLCLVEIPNEVLRMYDYDPDDKSSTAWYESVDVTRLLAGDNEIKHLPRELFPTTRLDGSEEEPCPGPFPNLAYLDLRGNQLEGLPDTIANAPLLESIDLTANRLSAQSVWDILFLVKTIKDLKLAKNLFSGSIPHGIAALEELEILDVHDNRIEDIPGSIGKLAKLKELNFSGNRLQSLPLEPIFDIDITRLNLSRNRLNGSFFPPTVPSFETLIHLDLSHNSLTHVAEGGVKLPNLKSLDVSNNRIIELPAMNAWSKLETLVADENKISAFPEGFAKSTSLRTVNLNNNSLLALEDDIGNMDNLATLHIENNPIRERKLMRMSTEELKAELRSRRAAEANTSSPRRFGTTDSSAGANAAAWTVSGGMVDRSNTRMVSIDEATVQQVADQTVVSLVLHHNQLQTVSPHIELLGATLVTLDLANNRLGRTESFVGTQICLPNLQTLNLTSNALTSLAPITANLSTPRLATLTLPFNRLTALPKNLCTAFPALKKLMVNNNKLTVLDIVAVRGLEVLDISSNDLEALPPQLGLLQGQLRTLMVNANKFRVPGWGVIEKGTEALLDWCKKQLPDGATLDGEANGTEAPGGDPA